MLKKILRFLPAVITGILVVTAGVYAWTEPSASPPGGNIAAPINVSSTAQTKTGWLGLGNITPASVLHIGSYGQTWGADISIDSTGLTGGKRWSLISTAGTAGEGQGKFLLKNTDPADTNPVKMVVTSDGKVGIGTTSPQYGLDVSGSGVNGIIRVGRLTAFPSDKTPDNGAIYYNTSDNEFKCFQNGKWWDCLSSAAAGGVSGTQNYVAKFTSSTAIGNSQIFDNGTFVGIGTLAPAYKFDVLSAGTRGINVSATLNSGADVYGTYSVAANSAGQSVGVFGQGGTHGVYAYNNSASGYALYVHQANASGYAVFSPSSAVSHFNGNVGIGITNPGAKLEIAGQIKITGGSPGSGKVLTSNASGLATWETPSTITGYWVASGANIYNTNTGNVGIGTTAPQQLLTLSASDSPVLRFDRSGTNKYDWEIYTKSGAGLYFRGGADGAGADLTDRMVITSGGNVGIGTTAPDQKFYVKGGNLKVESSNGDRSIWLGVTEQAVDLWAVGKPLHINNNSLNNDTFINLATGDVQILGDNTTYGEVPGRMVTIRGNLTVTEILHLGPRVTKPSTCSIGDIYADTSGAYCACFGSNQWEKMNATGSCQ